MIAIEQMVKQLSGLVGTKKVTKFESGFIHNIAAQLELGNGLSTPQAEVIERIYKKHFA